MRLSHALQGYWLEKQLHFSATTTPRYKCTFGRLIAFTGDAEIETITSNDLRRFLAWLATEHGLGKRSVHDAWVHLSSLWTWAEGELNIPHALHKHIAPPEFPDAKPVAFTQKEIKKLLAVLDRDASGAKRHSALRDRAIVMVLLDAGLRASELCSLTIGDYNAGTGRLHVIGKYGKERFVVIGSRTQRALWRYLATRENTAGAPLFATRSGGHMTRTDLRHLLVRLGKRAGVAGVHPHRFRHTFAITFLRNGGALAVLKELLGHETLEMSLHYAEIAQQDIDASVKHSPADGWRL